MFKSNESGIKLLKGKKNSIIRVSTSVWELNSFDELSISKTIMDGLQTSIEILNLIIKMKLIIFLLLGTQPSYLKTKL